jgi:hypothetical protein
MVQQTEWRKKTHPECGQHHPTGWDLLGKKKTRKGKLTLLYAGPS